MCSRIGYLYSSPKTIQVNKSRRMGWAGHAAQIKKRNAYNVFEGKSE
jgi:kynureninase